MNNSERAIPKILKHEGGYVNNPADPGGATNKGITIATFRRYIKPGGTIADLKALTESQAVVVYKRQYWDAVSADLLPSGVDYAVADFAVNSGPSRAGKYLQKVVGTAQDGVVGPATIAAARGLSAPDVINDICDERLAFMRRIRAAGCGKHLAVAGSAVLMMCGLCHWRGPRQKAPKPIIDTTPAKPPQRSLWVVLASLLASIFGKGKP